MKLFIVLRVELTSLLIVFGVVVSSGQTNLLLRDLNWLMDFTDRVLK